MTMDYKHQDKVKSIYTISTNLNKATCRRISYSLNTPIRRKYPIMRRHSGNCKQNDEQCLITFSPLLYLSSSINMPNLRQDIVPEY